MTRESEVRKNNDLFHRRSATALKREVKTKITKVFTGDLSMLEIKFGRDFDGYAELRADILRRGNDAIRYIEELIDAKYNVQRVPDCIVLPDQIIQRENSDEEVTSDV